MRRNLIGRTGEKKVAEVLTGCDWINREYDHVDFYDIEYKGIKIDVKTSTVRYKVYRMGVLVKDYFNFTEGGKNDGEKIKIYVGIDVDEVGNQKFLFWVREKYEYGNYKLTENAMTEEELFNYFCSK